MADYAHDRFIHVSVDGSAINISRDNIHGVITDTGITINESTVERGSKMELGVLVHELIHLELPEMTEEQVLQLERSFADFLWCLGFRRSPSIPPMPKLDDDDEAQVFSSEIK